MFLPDLALAIALSNAVLGTLVSHLPDKDRQVVYGIEFNLEVGATGVNAFAQCTDDDKPEVDYTIGFMVAIFGLAEAYAIDKFYGTELVSRFNRTGYKTFEGLESYEAQQSDPRVLLEAQNVFSDIVAFTLGHELAHHYLGHTECGKHSASTSNYVKRIIPNSQSKEGAADIFGTLNALKSGYSERGGVYLMTFLEGVQKRKSPVDPTAILDTHPLPELRAEMITFVAKDWWSRKF